MKKGLTELVIIIDKSGSMDGLEKDVIGGFNSLIKSQKEAEGEVRVTTVFFNGNHERIMEQRDINDVPELTEKDYRPTGCTALLDTVGTFIKEFQIKWYKSPFSKGIELNLSFASAISITSGSVNSEPLSVRITGNSFM